MGKKKRKEKPEIKVEKPNDYYDCCWPKFEGLWKYSLGLFIAFILLMIMCFKG